MSTKTTVTIRRPNGKTETVDVSKSFPLGMPATLQDRMRRETRDAGRGEVLSIDETDTRTASQIEADEAMRAVNEARNEASIIRANGGVSAAIAADAKTEKMEADYKANYPGNVSTRRQAVYTVNPWT